MFGYDHNPWRECSYCGQPHPCPCTARPRDDAPPVRTIRCPFCHGLGRIAANVPTRANVPCPMCYATGRMEDRTP